MKEKISEMHQKRSVLIKEAKKKDSDELATWMIEEYYVPNQAS